MMERAFKMKLSLKYHYQKYYCDHNTPSKLASWEIIEGDKMKRMFHNEHGDCEQLLTISFIDTLPSLLRQATAHTH